MKTYLYILLLTIFILSSCSSSIYMSGEYDDLYYTPSASQVYVQEYSANQDAYQSIAEIENQYDLDTLIGDEYFDPSIYDDDLAYYDTDRNSAFDYYSGGSYSRNLSRFYGNYFDPYWRYPYYGFGYNNFSYGFGYPYYSPYNYYGGYGGYNDFYDPFYSYYSYPYYRYSSYWGGYSPYGYSSYYYSPYIYSRASDNTEIQRRRSYSTLSNNYSRNPGSKAANLPTYGSRRNAEVLSSTNSATRRTATGSTLSNNTATGSRATTNHKALTSVQNQNVRRSDPTTTSTTRTSDKPVYNSANRIYTPTYTNPRMSTRPTYNTTTTKRNTSTGGTTRSTIKNSSTNRGAVTNRSVNSGSSIINRSTNSSTRTNYSTPTRTNNTGTSRSSSVNSSRSISSGSSIRSTSSSSISSGSSSSGGRSSSSSSSSSSSGRRR